MSGGARWRKRPTVEPSRFSMEDVAEAIARNRGRRGLGPRGPVELPDCAAESIKEGPGHGAAGTASWATLDFSDGTKRRRR